MTILATIKDKLRASPFLLGAILGLVLIAFIAPQQLGVIAYKATILSLAAYAGYWADRIIFPNARVDDMAVAETSVFTTAQLRRAIMVGATLIASGLAL